MQHANSGTGLTGFLLGFCILSGARCTSFPVNCGFNVGSLADRVACLLELRQVDGGLVCHVPYALPQVASGFRSPFSDCVYACMPLGFIDHSSHAVQWQLNFRGLLSDEG